MPTGALIFLLLGFRNSQSDPLSWSLPQWTAWRDAQISQILEPTFDNGGEQLLNNVDLAVRAKKAHDLIAGCLAKNPAYFTSDSGRRQAMAHFIAFVEAQSRSAERGANGAPTHALGLAVSDLDYADEVVRDISIPPLLASQPFLELMRTPTGYRAAVEMIDRFNTRLPEASRWKTLPFESRFLRSADLATYGRLMVMVPEPERNLDLWFNFALVTPDLPASTPAGAVSLVAVRTDQPTQCLILDFMRVADGKSGEINFVPAVKDHPDPNDRCYDCHKSPVLPVEPLREFGFDRSGNLEALDDPGPTRLLLNKRIAAYPKTSFQAADPASFGPCLGSKRDRSDEFIRQAAGETLSAESIGRIRAQMRCASCHDNYGTLNFPSGLSTSRDVHALRDKQSIARTYAENGWMPPNNDLTPSERQVLWKCLSKEYYDPVSGTGTLVDWLKGGN